MHRANQIELTPAGASRRPCVLHWAGRITDEVFGFLWPATLALAERGFEQTVVAFDDDASRRMMPLLDEAVDIVPVPPDGVLRGWLHSVGVVREALQRLPVTAVHLHGFIPAAATALVPELDGRTQLYWSPRTSSLLTATRGTGAVRKLVLRSILQRPPLAGMPRQDIRLEGPVSEAFFDVAAAEARHPLLLTGSHVSNPRGAGRMAQLAVLLGDRSLRLSFNWLGPADAACAQRLRAANVQAFDAADERERAVRLAAGWVYLAMGGTRGFPVSLAEAMAAGLPCVAIDNAGHRDLVEHSRTGFLFRREEELLRYVARLVDSRELRMHMGAAAREEAKNRFRQQPFKRSLLSAYGLNAAPAGGMEQST